MACLHPQAKIDEYSKNAYKLAKMRKDDHIVVRARKEIEAFHEVMPLLQEVANPALMARHWTQIFQVRIEHNH
jgi:dynein heavy chain, axonemal